LALGDALVSRRLIAARDDVFFLTSHELIELSRGAALLPASVRETIEHRRAAHERLRRLTPPDSFTLPEGEYFDADHSTPDAAIASSSVLSGTTACGGRTTGRA